MTAGTESAGTAGSYNAADTGSSYNIGGYDMNSSYANYAQMYEQYYGSQAQVVTCRVSYC